MFLYLGWNYCNIIIFIMNYIYYYCNTGRPHKRLFHLNEKAQHIKKALHICRCNDNLQFILAYAQIFR